jgi:hypothetical protein
MAGKLLEERINLKKNSTIIYKMLQQDFAQGTLQRTQISVSVKCFQNGRKDITGDRTHNHASPEDLCEK